MSELISRQAAIEALNKEIIKRRLLDDANDGMLDEFDTESILRNLPSAQPESKKLSNKEWIDFLSEQFDISRTSAGDMLHGMMMCKKEDNFKKMFNQRGDHQ